MKAMFQGLACHFEPFFGLLAIPKCDLFDVEKSMFQGLAWHFYPIYILTSPKFYFGEIKKATFEVVARHLELNFFLLNSPKCDLGEVEKAMYQGLACDFELIFGLLTIPKCVLAEVEKAIFKASHVTLNSFSAS